MNIQSVFSNPMIHEKTLDKVSTDRQVAQNKFSDFLRDAIEVTNAQQIKSERLTEKLVLGENVELHEVMIAAEKASITLNTTLEIRNKVIEAYQEISRMQV